MSCTRVLRNRRGVRSVAFLVLLAAVPALGWAFVRWERRVVGWGGAPVQTYPVRI